MSAACEGSAYAQQAVRTAARNGRTTPRLSDPAETSGWIDGRVAEAYGGVRASALGKVEKRCMDEVCSTTGEKAQPCAMDRRDCSRFPVEAADADNKPQPQMVDSYEVSPDKLTYTFKLRDEFGASIVLITHDLGVVAETADRVLVMYAGCKVEEAAVDDLFARPRHPYTAGRLGAVPRVVRGPAPRQGRLADLAVQAVLVSTSR